MDVTISFKNVGLCYRRRAWSFWTRSKTLRKQRKYWALREISFDIHKGETVGIVGSNGSGKSTTTLLCAGIYTPDEGEVFVDGRVSLLNLNAGLRPELTGLENIRIKGSYHGLSKNRIKEKIDQIVEFAELEEFINEPIRTYSSGMKARLGFAVATSFQPETLIIDEVMAVGDEMFRAKAKRRLESLGEKAKTVIIVSHQTRRLKEQCSRVIWLHKGKLVMDGPVLEVLDAYQDFWKEQEDIVLPR